MGSQESKIADELPRDELSEEVPTEESSEGSVPTTPILTPKILKAESFDYSDPRSPSANIARTPIQLLFKESINELVETPQRTHITLSVDPRSPTVDFDRTPIVVNAKETLLQSVHKRNLQNKTQIPPKLIDSSPIAPKTDASKRKSFVGLLETNIDFTETDLDQYMQEKNKVVKNESVDPRSPTTSFVRTPMQISKRIVNIDLDDKDESKVVEETDLNEEKEEEIESEVVETIEETVEIVEEKDSAKIVTEITKTVETVLTITEKKEGKLNFTADVKDFDKKLTDLIYEDKNCVVVPRLVKLRETNRTPLGIRNSTGEIKKSLQKLRVSDKPRKSEFTVSRIPVFREKGKKLNIQCENTPPRNMEKKLMKSRRTQWDNDNTLVI